MKKEILLVALFIGLAFCQIAQAQTTEFTYQGKLTDTGTPAANYDFELRLYDALTGGAQQGATVTKSNVPVASGIFTVTLDFGSQFSGASRFLDISVKKTTDPTFTLLTPRQQVNSAPYSVKSLTADTATTATNATNATNDSGGTVSGNGAGLTNLNGANISTGTVTVDQLAPNLIDGPQRNLTLLASRRWDLLKPQSNFAVGSAPIDVAFDGANIWVPNQSSNNVTKLRASDGAVQGTFAVGTAPYSVAFDGANIWVANSSSVNVTKLRASDGAVQGTFAVGGNSRGIAFDGANIWVSNTSSNGVTKLRASDGAVQGTFAVGINAFGVAFDGTNIWVANYSTNNVTRLFPAIP